MKRGVKGEGVERRIGLESGEERRREGLRRGGGIMNTRDERWFKELLRCQEKGGRWGKGREGSRGERKAREGRQGL